MDERDINKSKEHAQAAAGEVKEKVKEVASEAADKAKETTHELRQRASGAVRGATTSASRLLTDVGDALDQTAHRLDQEQHDTAGHYMHQAATQVRHVGEMIRERDLDDFVSGIERFSRNQPGLFLGGTALLGFALGRFLTSSKSHQPERDVNLPHTYEAGYVAQTGPGIGSTGYGTFETGQGLRPESL